MTTLLKAYIPTSLKQLLKKLPIRFTQNQRYDFQTKKILELVLFTESNCIDVGCFKGEILDLLLTQATNGRHYAFEPIPDKFTALEHKYDGNTNVTLHNLALSDHKGTTVFNHVITNPSYSGIKKRDYDLPNEQDQQITVSVDTLDNLIPADTKIALIKIDVEGAEYLVMQGAHDLISKWKPVIIFEHGLGGSNHYGYGPEEVFDFITSCDMVISNLDSYLSKKSPLTSEDFKRQYFEKMNYYFVAHPIGE